jgi:Cu/Ag efflux protein CusF
MKLVRIVAVACLVLLAGVLSAQDGPQKGTIKKVDADKGTLTLAADGKDLVVKVTAETRVMDTAGKSIDDPFKNNVFKPGAAILFKADGDTLVGIRIGDPNQAKGDGKQLPGPVRQGKIVKIDPDALTITVKADGKDLDLVMTEETRVLDRQGKTLKEKLQGFKPDAEVNFVVEKKDGKEYLFGIRLLDGKGEKGKGPQPFVKVDSSKLIPIDELGDKEYKAGFKGGFYPDGKNERPKEHEAAGLRLAKEIQPRNAEGKVDPQGKIVMLSVGMSNTSQASMGFKKALESADKLNPRLIFVNGAVGGQTADRIQDPDSATGAKYWAIVDKRFEEAKVTRAQVQVIWIKEADIAPQEGFPGYAQKLEKELANIVRIFPKRFPNGRLVYLSSRTYGGYAETPLNPEPVAYESAFAVKWLIERQIKGEADLNFDPKKGEVKAPWLSWGPYLWANGSKKRADGFSYEREDFTKDGTHHSDAGSAKIGRRMLRFFESDTTTRPWFTAN